MNFLLCDNLLDSEILRINVYRGVFFFRIGFVMGFLLGF